MGHLAGSIAISRLGRGSLRSSLLDVGPRMAQSQASADTRSPQEPIELITPGSPPRCRTKPFVDLHRPSHSTLIPSCSNPSLIRRSRMSSGIPASELTSTESVSRLPGSASWRAFQR